MHISVHTHIKDNFPQSTIVERLFKYLSSGSLAPTPRQKSMFYLLFFSFHLSD